MAIKMVPAAKSAMEAYRRVELDARVEGADGIGLTRLCLEHALTELDRANRASQHGARNDALLRAAASVSGLRQGVASDNPMREPLLHLYSACEDTIRAGLSDYRREALDRVRTDLHDIAALIASPAGSS